MSEKVTSDGITIPGAKKFDSGKPMFDLLIDGLPYALTGVAEVLTYGFMKYGGKHGWKELPDAIARYKAALLRHEVLAAKGEYLDAESGMPHRMHIACNALFLAELEQMERTRSHERMKAICQL